MGQNRSRTRSSQNIAQQQQQQQNGNNTPAAETNTNTEQQQQQQQNGNNTPAPETNTNTEQPQQQQQNGNNTPAAETNTNTEQQQQQQQQQNGNNTPAPETNTNTEQPQEPPATAATTTATDATTTATDTTNELTDEEKTDIAAANNISQEEVAFLWVQYNKYPLDSDKLIRCDVTTFSDPFSKNIFRRIPRLEGQFVKIDFPSFAQYLAKWSNSNGLVKSQLLFQTLYNGDPLTKSLLTKLISLVDPDSSQSEREELVEKIVKVMDSKSSGIVDLDDFVGFFSRQDARAAINNGIKLALV